LKRVEIGELKVGRLDIRSVGREPGALTAVVRIRSAPGKGDALAKLLLDQASLSRSGDPGVIVRAPHRAAGDADLFMFYEEYADEAAFERRAHAARLDALRRRIADQGLASGGAVEVEIYRTI
jgi:quinol monooxygenase YgiN